MNRLIRILTGLLFLGGLCTLEAALSETSLDEVKSYLLEQQKSQGIPALGLAIIEGQSLRFVGASSILEDSPVNKHTAISAPGLSEAMTSLLAAVLVREGKITLDSPARRLDSRFGTAHSDGGKAVTLRHLLEHTAGIPNYVDETLSENWARPDDVYVTLKQTPVANSPGEVFEESHTSLAAAGYLMASAAGLGKDLENGFPQAMHAYVFAPLGMQHTRISGAHALAPVEGLNETTLHDLALWIRAEMNQGRLPSNAFIADPLSMRERHRPQKRADARQRGMGWFEHFYQMSPVIARLSQAKGDTVMVGFLPEFETGFVLWLRSMSDDAEALAAELPLTLIELSKHE